MNKNWLDNPITWRKYFKVSGVCAASTVVAYIAVLIKTFGGIEGLIDIFKLSFKKD